MNTQRPDIEKLILHIIDSPNAIPRSKYFKIGDYSSEYGTTDIKSKAREHKLWTPCKDRKHQCFLIMQQQDSFLIIQHVLDDINNITKKMRPLIIKTFPSQTLATRCNAKDQFKGSLEINIKDINSNKSMISTICKLITSITDKTIEDNLNKRKKSRN